MRFVEPEVYVIGETELNDVQIDKFLEDIGADEFDSDTDSYGEYLVEIAGRLCYNSFQVGLNPNVTKVREDSSEYIKNIIESKHGSVLEHVTVNFIFRNVSRVFTHELVRHRVGTAISQESLRYVRIDDLGFYLPNEFKHDEKIKARCKKFLEDVEQLQRELAQDFCLDDENVPFSVKKKCTSAMRRLAPQGMATAILWSCNLRELRNIIEQRTSPHAEEEIRVVFGKVAEAVIEMFPSIFSDYKKELVDGLYWYITKNTKI